MSTTTSTQCRPPCQAGRILPAIGALTLLVVVSLLFMDQMVARAAFVPGQLLVKTRHPIPEASLAKQLHGKGLLYRKTLRHSNVHVIRVSDKDAEKILAALRADPEVEFAERDGLAAVAFVPNDPYVLSGQEWHLDKMQAPQAWQVTAGGPQAVIAVLDSGVNAAHPDLAGRILPGYDFVGNDSDPADDFGHGTAVVGVIAANGNNGLGVAGVAFDCSVLPVKVVDSSGFAAYSVIAEGIRYAVDQGARIINISIAGTTPSFALQAAIDYAWGSNVLVVAAAGNAGNTDPQYPAACNHVLAVSATEPDDSLAGFSSFGTAIALSAPGDIIWTTHRDLANPYAAWRGTSFASPMVAAVAGLLASADPSLSSIQLVWILENSADDLGLPGWDPSFGYGRVNAARALNEAGFNVTQGAGEPSAPTVPDLVLPSVRLVQAPINGARLSSPSLFLRGTATDNLALDRVELSLNGAGFEPAAGSTNWQATVALAPGTNIVRIRAADAAGNYSPEILRWYFNVLTSRLSLVANGLGRIAPNLDGAELEIGRGYKIRAIPAPGQVFAGWGGSGQGEVLQFVMQSNLTLVANFVPSPFLALQGTYAGLVANGDAVAASSSGSFALAVNASGRFTGRLILAGQRSGFAGRFDLNGNASLTIRRAGLAPLQLGLHLDLTGGTDAVTGTVTDGAWTAQAEAQRNVFNRRRNPPPQAGVRRFILEEQSDIPVTAGTGLGRICPSGGAAVRGKLSDGRVFVSSAIVGRGGDYPLFLSFHHGTEVVIGWVNFPAISTPTASGTVVWVNSGTNGFAATLQVASAP